MVVSSSRGPIMLSRSFWSFRSNDYHLPETPEYTAAPTYIGPVFPVLHKVPSISNDDIRNVENPCAMLLGTTWRGQRKHIFSHMTSLSGTTVFYQCFKKVARVLLQICNENPAYVCLTAKQQTNYNIRLLHCWMHAGENLHKQLNYLKLHISSDSKWKSCSRVCFKHHLLGL